MPLGCEAKTTFSGENADGRIPTLVISSSREISMRHWPWEFWKCSVNFGSSWFVGYNGSKRLFTQQYLNATSNLVGLFRSSLQARYVLKVSALFYFSPSLLAIWFIIAAATHSKETIILFFSFTIGPLHL